MNENSYVGIDAAYSDAVNDAVAKHEHGVSDANEKLAHDLAKTSDPDERAEILQAFDREIAPVRDAYHAAVEEAEAKREAALRKINPEGETP